MGSVEVIKSLERSPGSNPVDGAAFRRSPVFSSSVVRAVRALDRCSPWALAVGAVERVQDCEFPARSDFEDSPVIRWAVFKRRPIEVSVAAERESTGGKCASYSLKAVKYGDLARRSGLENRTCIVGSTIVRCAVEIPVDPEQRIQDNWGAPGRQRGFRSCTRA